MKLVLDQTTLPAAQDITLRDYGHGAGPHIDVRLAGDDPDAITAWAEALGAQAERGAATGVEGYVADEFEVELVGLTVWVYHVRAVPAPDPRDAS